MKAKDIAEYFLSLVDEEKGDFLTNLKIQKLLYYAEGFSLAISKTSLFEEKIMAWNYGPVVVEVYNEYKQYNSNPVLQSSDFDNEKYDSATKDLLNEVYDVYGRFSPSALVDMTHSEAPWINAKKSPKTNFEISRKAMQSYFSTQLIEGK